MNATGGHVEPEIRYSVEPLIPKPSYNNIETAIVKRTHSCPVFI
jgi:hypothetical protein